MAKEGKKNLPILVTPMSKGLTQIWLVTRNGQITFFCGKTLKDGMTNCGSIPPGVGLFLKFNGIRSHMKFD